MSFNSCQTEYTEEYISKLPKEVQEQYYDFITNVPYIRKMISPDRPYARDLNKDSEGKIVVDISNPHILEDTDYFRPSALHYEKFGCYTKLRPNSNPNSEYGKWIREEIRRCWEGYVRKSDGEWITGDMYFFLNYCPIQLIKKDKKGKSIRTIGFPRFWDGHYYMSHYLQQCREEGHHAATLAKRGAGKAHPYNEIVYTPTGKKLWKDVKVGDFLFGDDGNLTKIIGIPFDDYASIYEITLSNGYKVKCSSGHLWKVKSHSRGDTVISTEELLSLYKRPRKISERNPKGYELDCLIPRGNGIELSYKKTKIDPYTFGLLLGNGCFRNKNYADAVLFSADSKDMAIYKDYIPYEIKKHRLYSYSFKIKNVRSILTEYGLFFKKSEDKFIPDEYKYNSRDVRINILKGLLDTDATAHKNKIEIVLSSKKLIEDIRWMCASLGIPTSNIRIKNTWYYDKDKNKIPCLTAYRLSIYPSISLFNLPRKLKLWKNRSMTNYGQSKYRGYRIMDIRYIGTERAKCVTVDNASHCYLINNFIVTHNSFFAASMLAKRFILGESKEVNKKVQCVATASERKYIQGANQLLDMFQYYIDFCANNTEFPRQRITNSLQNLAWTMGYVDAETNTRKGTENSVIGVTSKDDESKLRGSRGVLYLLEEAGCHLKGTKCYRADKTLESVENIKIGDELLGPDMLPRKVKKVYSGTSEMYKITLSNGDYQVVTTNHPVYVKIRYWGKHKKEVFKTFTCGELLDRNYKKGHYILKQPIIYEHKEVLIDPYLLGLWLGDGDSSRLSFAAPEKEIRNYFNSIWKNNCYLRNCTNTDACKIAHFPKSLNGSLYDAFNHYNLFNNKHIPEDYIHNDKEINLKLLSGIIDSDGYYDSKKHLYEIVQHHSRKQIIYALKELCTNLGMKCTVTTKIGNSTSPKPNELYYRLFIRSNIEIPVIINKKKYKSRSNYRNKLNWLEYSFTIEPYGYGQYYGFLLDKDHLFLLDDNTIVHNTFPKLLNIFQILRPSVEDGSNVYGLLYLYGTAGQDDSDFGSMQELMYNPDGYNLKKLDNVYDKEGQGKKYFTYFFPGYMNRADCYDENGNSDVIKALMEILIDRHKVKYNSSNINAISRRISEIPITPQEAILKTRGNMFPITEITQRINEIDNNPSFFNDVYIGNLTINSKGEVDFTPSNDIPIRDFPTKDNKVTGALEIYEMPQKVHDKIPNDRYILSLDNYENDEAQSMSLGSMFVLDLWTDRIVAEYTGRPMFADDLNELCRKLCLFYHGKVMCENNKKNTFAYFSRMNSLHLMADTPEYLKNKQIIKFSGYGNSTKGITATAATKNFALGLIRDWLLKPVTVNEEKNGEVNSYTVTNLNFIKNRALLKELMLFNPVINVDRCVFKDTKILTKNGYINIQNIREGDLVVTANGTLNKVYHVQQNLFKGIKCKFRALGDYRFLKCTDNHPILTCHSIGAKGKYWMKSKFNLSTPEYKRADELNKNDYVLIPTRKNLNITPISEDLLYLIGWYIADGNVSHNAVRFSLQENQYEIAKKLVNIINKYYKRSTTYIAPKIKNGKQVKDYIANIPAEAHLNHTKELYKGRLKKMWIVEIHSKDLADFLVKHGGQAHHKTISEELYNCYNVMPLLRGYFEGDGHYRCEKRCDGVERNSLECSTIYEDLALKVRQLLLDNNIWCTIRKVNMKNSRKSSKPQYNINLVNENVLPIIKDSLKFTQKLATHSLFKKEHFIKNNYGYWIKIKDFSSVLEEDITYNISVLNDPSYVANGITTHNCMSLCQLMMYREEKMIAYQGDPSKYKDVPDTDYLGNDDFFNQNYVEY